MECILENENPKRTFPSMYTTAPAGLTPSLRYKKCLIPLAVYQRHAGEDAVRELLTPSDNALDI
jgi:hypothetical protein